MVAEYFCRSARQWQLTRSGAGLWGFFPAPHLREDPEQGKSQLRGYDEKSGLMEKQL